MKKKVLILVLSSDFPPYSQMIQTSKETWNSVQVDGCETVFCCGNSKKKSSDDIIYFPVENGLYDMGHKTIAMLEWALQNKDFDYIARTNASCYVHKKELVSHVQNLPEQNVFAGLVVTEERPWVWGGGMFLISKDVVQSIVENKSKWKHDKMEDMAMSYLVSELGIPFTNGTACSIDKLNLGWRCMCYGTESFTFDDFKDIKKSKGQFFFRCKQDHDRSMDAYVMKELFKNLNND